MATAKISYIIDDCKRKASVLKWIENQKATAKSLAYDNRRIIDKKEVEYEISKLDYVLPLWELFKKLRKKNEEYNCLISTDKKGYISIQVVFPITQEELSKAIETRREYIRSNKPFGSIVCRLPEEVWKVCHERINKVFSGFILRDYQSYEEYGNPLHRWVDIVGVKC